MRYEIVIFSNQSRISFEPKAKLFPQWKQKLQAIAETVYFTLFFSDEDGYSVYGVCCDQ